MIQDEPYRNKEIDYAAPLTPEDIAAGRHRRRVGRKWGVMGGKQLEFLIAHGMRPEHRLLDVGCGALRAGRHFVEYLEPGNYYGIDINGTLIDAGYERELPAELRRRLPRENLRQTERFNCDFGVPFDFAIANSVFTHVSLNHIRLCLYRVAKHMAPGGRFYASFFEAPPWFPLDQPRHAGSRWTERNAFFYYRNDLRWAARCAAWDVTYIGRWGHPGNQRMMEFRYNPAKARRRHVLARGARLARRARRTLGAAASGGGRPTSAP